MAINVLKNSVSVTHGSRESDASGRDSLIFSVTQAASYSFAYHVSCKVKVANVRVRIRGEDNVLRAQFMCFAVLSFRGPNQLSAVDHA